MKTALVFIEHDLGEIKKGSLESLSALQGKGWTINTCAMGPAGSLKETLVNWGVSKHIHGGAEEETFNPGAVLEFLDKAYETCKPHLILASSNTHSRDVFPRLAARKDAAFMNDVTELTVSDKVTALRPLYAGKCTAKVEFLDESCRILLLRPNQIPVAAGNTTGQLEWTEISPPPGSDKCKTLSVQAGESTKLDLTEASVIVSGGRGLKEAENFKLLEELAAPLGATVGASRAVVDLGWVPHSLQVGQTGKTVAPTLYFAVGISGAIQHLAGMSGSKNIVAINKDDKAPIFQKATYGIVGDLFEVVPVLTEKLKSLR